MKLPCMYCKPTIIRKGKQIEVIREIHFMGWNEWLEHIFSKKPMQPSQHGYY